jgi:hypothetical protein
LPLNNYRLTGSWRVLGRIDEVYEVLSTPVDFPRWWPAAFRDVLEIQPGDEHGIDRVDRFESRGWLPVFVRWHTSVEDATPPAFLDIKAWGDIDGRGEWRLVQNGAWTDLTYDWRLRLHKPVLRFLSPLLRPALAASLRSAMDRGEESLRLELARRNAANAVERAGLPSPPVQGEAPVLPLVLAGAGVAAALIWSRRRRPSPRSTVALRPR